MKLCALQQSMRDSRWLLTGGARTRVQTAGMRVTTMSSLWARIQQTGKPRMEIIQISREGVGTVEVMTTPGLNAHMEQYVSIVEKKVTWKKIALNAGDRHSLRNRMQHLPQMREFKRGDWVLRFYPPGLNRSKLNPQYIGPYLVLSRQGEVTYKIQLGPQNKPITVHVDHLKHFECEQPPQSWVEVDNVRETPHTDDNGIVTQLPDPSDTQSTLRNNVPQEDTTLETTSEHKRNQRTQRRRKMPSKFRDYLI